MNPPINTLSPVSTIIRVEIFTALEIAKAEPLKKKQTAATHAAQGKIRLIFNDSGCRRRDTAWLRWRVILPEKRAGIEPNTWPRFGCLSAPAPRESRQ